MQRGERGYVEESWGDSGNDMQAVGSTPAHEESKGSERVRVEIRNAQVRVYRPRAVNMGRGVLMW